MTTTHRQDTPSRSEAVPFDEWAIDRLDVNAYLARIGYCSNPEATFGPSRDIVGIEREPAEMTRLQSIGAPSARSYQAGSRVPYQENRMKYGFIATQGTMPETLELARMVEHHGWDGFFTWDGISVGPMPTWDPWVVMGAVATQTERVTLGAIVHPLSRRRPWKVVREALTVDHLSNGRLVIPVALGAVDDGGFSRVHPEVTDRKQRAERLDETLEIMKLAWQGEPFSYDGAHYRVNDLVLQPRPVNGDIPVWVVGAWPSRKSVGRAARYQGILPTVVGDPEGLTPEMVREIVAWVKEHRASDRPFDFVVEGVTPIGDPDAADAQVQAWADAGATWWLESMWGDYTLDDLRRRIAQGPPRV